MTETWLPVAQYEDTHEVSSEGRVRSTRGLLAQHRDKDGYWNVGLTRNGAKKRWRVHRLVCEAFNGPSSGDQVAHLDGDPNNNAAPNLSWASASENNRHKSLHGTHPRGERASRARLSNDDVLSIRERMAAGESSRDLSAEFGIHRTYVCQIARGARPRSIATTFPASSPSPTQENSNG